MNPALRRDLIMIGSLVVAIVVSLITVRTVAGSSNAPDPAAVSVITSTTTAAASRIALVPSRPIPATSTVATGNPLAPAPPAAGSLRTVQLSAGATVNPRPPTTVTARPAPTTDLPAALPAAPTGQPDPADPAQITAAWLNALCAYDFRQSDPTAHQLRAHAFGDTAMPAQDDPFTFDPTSWTTVTTQRLSSACTDITVDVDPPPIDRPGLSTARITAIQVLAVDDTPMQQLPLLLTRALTQDPTGAWRVGAPVTAN